VTREKANQIYDVLMATCGATEYWRDNFILSLTEQDCREYRFQGLLGFGGKLYVERHVPRGPHGARSLTTIPKYRVSCYREDETPERLSLMTLANERLSAM
jgi:hypothetical protein